VTIARHTVAPFLLVLACTACGLGEDPLAASDVGLASSPPTLTQTPSPSPTPRAKPAPKQSTSQQSTSQQSTSQRFQATLPRGGREVFPRYRLVGYAGVTGASTLGRLGTGPLDQRVAEIERRAKPYAAGREILPVVEVIATLQGSPGRDGKYRVRLTDAQIAKYHKAARKHRAVMLLNLRQVGRSSSLRRRPSRSGSSNQMSASPWTPNGPWIEVSARAVFTRTRLAQSSMKWRVSSRSGQAVRPSREGDGLSPGRPQRGTPGIPDSTPTTVSS
jgi:hypothetical protein